ncbi:MAG: hypothetical protein GX137_04015 [Thermoplasmatales archaeon]|nr:hypothetical protein [Thermoplasmatales archaeon]
MAAPAIALILPILMLSNCVDTEADPPGGVCGDLCDDHGCDGAREAVRSRFLKTEGACRTRAAGSFHPSRN